MSLFLQWRSLAAAFLLLSPLAVGALAHTAQAEPHALQEADGLGWTSGYTMVLLEEGADLQNARRWIQARGGRVAILLPPRVLTGWIPPTLDSQLVGHAGIRSVHRQAAPSAAEFSDSATRSAARYFDRVVQGRLPAPELVKPHAAPKLPPGSDAFNRGSISQFEVLENLRSRQTHDLWKLGKGEIVANSEHMVGTVTVSLFFVESDGSDSDPDQFDWTTSAEQDVYDEAIAGLSWWSDQAEQHADCWVSFLVQAHFATQDTRLEQAREPVLHDSATYAAIVSDVLENFGYGVGSHISRATAYNTSQRLANDTDWAYSAFIAANPTGADSFTDGFAAWAFLGGPYTALLQRSFNWQFRQVFAHESGHIFGACDEYHVEGYGGCNGCNECWTTGVDNGNCEQCNASSVNCMMKKNTWNLCSYTAGQLGWWRTPCIAGPLPAPIVDVLTPNQMWHAEGGILELQGEYFNPGSDVDLGPGVLIKDVTYVSANLLQLDVEVDPESPSGLRDLVVEGPDGGSTTVSQAFEVRATRVHYVSAFGSNVFPFASPTTAASDISSVLSVASQGDTLRLAAGVYNGFTLNKELVIEGGWAHDFNSRLPEDLPTILNATGSIVRIAGAGLAPVLDGLFIRGGGGNAISSPELGTTDSGGGVLSFDASPVFRNCVFEDNVVGSSAQDGVGGGVFLNRSDATFDHCRFRNNKAGRGGALFALDAHITLRGNVFENNTVEPLWGLGSGAAISLYRSTATLQDDVFDGNQMATNGGAIHASEASGLQATGVQFLSHSVSGNGAAIWATDSDVELTACDFTDNTAGNRGGALFVQSGSLSMQSSLLVNNEATTLGGAIYTDLIAPELHNLTLTGNTGGPASGLYLSNVQPGAVLHNSLLAFNTLGGLVFASGTPPTLSWNTYWQNGGLDVLGMTPGSQDQMIDPLLVDAPTIDLHLGAHSALIDAGDPAVLDADGSRSDCGAYGGPLARSLAPHRTSGLRSQPTRVGTRLIWDPSQSTQIARYLIYRGSEVDFQPGAGTLVDEVHAPTTTWEDIQPPADSWYKVAAIDATGRAGGYSFAAQAQQPTDVPSRQRHELSLEPIYPNPTNPSASIEFALPQAIAVQVNVYDARGRRIRQLARGVHPAGVHRLSWDGSTDDGQAAGSGVYWIRMHTAQESFARKLILVR